MSGIRSKNTKPEIMLRKALFAKGYRFRLHSFKLFGKPDLVFPKYKAVIFIHGCFWHGHTCHLFKWPSSHSDFWKQKITRNRQKDNEVISKLLAEKWRVLIVWECACRGKTKLSVEKIIKKITGWLEKKSSFQQIEGKRC